MEPELDPRLKALSFKVRAASRESQKAMHIVDSDLRTHWSTATNAKEWILLELEDSCLLSHIRVHNKSVLEWEISVGLKFKPEAFVKVRPRCEAPRREMTYHVGYVPCRFVRISCLRGNPIAIFFVQLMGIPVPGLEPEFQPVVDYLLPHIISPKEELHALYLELLQDITSRLSLFLPQLEGMLAVGESMSSSLKLLAMLVGPFYGLVNAISTREAERISADAELVRSSQSSLFAVSSNFQGPPKRVKNSGIAQQPPGQTLAYRPDAIILLLKIAASKEALANICKKVSKILSSLKFSEVTAASDTSLATGNSESSEDDAQIAAMTMNDYTPIFGEQLKPADDDAVKLSNAGFLDVALIEEGLLHFLYGIAAQPVLYTRLAKYNADFVPVLAYIQAILPALRPTASRDHLEDAVDETFSAWQAPHTQRAVTQVVLLTTAAAYRPLLESCRGYLVSYSAAHERAACILVDLCDGPLSPWLPTVIAKVDLAVELIEELLGVIQTGQSTERARAALIYLLLALSGQIDDFLGRYKDVKLKLLFLIEMLEKYLISALNPHESISTPGAQSEDESFHLALNFIRTAVQTPSILPSLEAEWMKGHISSRILLSILAPHLPLPPGLDTLAGPGSHNNVQRNDEVFSSKPDVADAKDAEVEESNFYFAPPELKGLLLATTPEEGVSRLQSTQFEGALDLDEATLEQHFDLQVDYLQLVSSGYRELHASEFLRFAADLHTKSMADAGTEGRQAAVDALLLGAECHLNPFFLDFNLKRQELEQRVILQTNNEAVAQLEEERDKAVLNILLKAAELDRDILVEGDDTFNTSNELEGLSIATEDASLEDATTIVRRKQSLLCSFFLRQLRREIRNMCEVLLQGLLFLLQSTSGLQVPPEHMIEAILKSAERLNQLIQDFYVRSKEGTQHSLKTLYAIRRQWSLLIRIVDAVIGKSSGGGNRGSHGHILQKELIPPWAWLDAIPKFSLSTYPLVRYIGWMALTGYAKVYGDNGLLLSSSMEHLSGILHICADELTYVEDEPEPADEDLEARFRAEVGDTGPAGKNGRQELVRALYPEVHIFFPTLRSQFNDFVETLVAAVCDQMRSIPPAAVPDLLSWLTDLCQDPFPQHKEETKFRGLAASNVKTVILRLLRAIIVDHMEAIVPELPRLVQLLLRLCSSSYCDISMLESILSALKPLVSYAAMKDALLQAQQCSQNFSAICFRELLDHIKTGPDATDGPSGPLLLFLAGHFLTDTSSEMQAELVAAVLQWVDFTKRAVTGSYVHYLRAFDKIFDSLRSLMESNLEGSELSTYYGSASTETGLQLQTRLSPSLDSINAEGDADFVEVDNLSNSSEVGASLEESEVQHLEDGQPEFIPKTGAGAAHYPSRLNSELLKQELQVLQAISPELEASWKLHPRLCSTLAGARARCLLLASYLSKKDAEQKVNNAWTEALSSLAQSISDLQQSRCWQVVGPTMEFLLSLPSPFQVQEELPEICSILEYQSTHAPKLTWRMWAAKWLVKALHSVGLELSNPAASSLVRLLNTMLEHPEPEQRTGALSELGKILDRNEHISHTGIEEASQRYSYDKFVRKLVGVTWERVAWLAASDPLLAAKQQALELLVKFVPLAQPAQLESLLATLDAFFALRMSSRTSPLTGVTLALFARASLYVPLEHLAGVPAGIWSRVELLAAGPSLTDSERAVCRALLQLRECGEPAKKDLENALEQQPTTEKPGCSRHFADVREAVLKVFARLDVQRTRADGEAAAAREAAQELREAEIELELLTGQASSSAKGASTEDDLQKLKAKIMEEERAGLRAEVSARRERRRIAQRERQLALEEAAQREIEVLQELDRERALEAEREIERQKALEKERAKTREMRHLVELEMERRTQRDYQRDLEQRSVRRDYTTTTTATTSASRPRERYRDAGGGVWDGAGNSSNNTNQSTSRPDRENALTPPPTPPTGPAVTGSPNAAGSSSASRSSYPSGFTERPYDELLGAAMVGEYGNEMDGGDRQRQSTGTRPRQIMERREPGRKWERKA